MKFVLASKNRGKLAEMQKILSDLGVEVILQSDLNLDLDVEETGNSFYENSRLKAKAVCDASGYPAIADDSGLCVDALNGAPGIYSARYGGLDSDSARNMLLLNSMHGASTRAAHFHTTIVCVFPNGDEIVAEGNCAGTIAYAPMGNGGFGYDPIFYMPEFRKTFGQLTADEKNEVSHRGKALKDFASKLKEYMENH